MAMDSGTSFDTTPNVADIVRRWGAERPDSVALTHGARTLTYAELHRRSSSLAQHLAALGVVPGVRVAYLGTNGIQGVELIFATAKLGAVLVPLNWRLSRRELAQVMADAVPLVVVCGGRFEALAHDVLNGLETPCRLVSYDPDTGGVP